jgi:hypothetical protein
MAVAIFTVGASRSGASMAETRALYVKSCPADLYAELQAMAKALSAKQGYISLSTLVIRALREWTDREAIQPEAKDAQNTK